MAEAPHSTHQPYVPAGSTMLEFSLRALVLGLMIAFGHSFLAMSGFETLAQIYREIASPKLKNLKITANIVCFYSVISTGLVTLFAVMIIPDSVRKNFYDNMIGGLAMHLAGPYLLRLSFHAFVVLVGALIGLGVATWIFQFSNGLVAQQAMGIGDHANQHRLG